MSWDIFKQNILNGSKNSPDTDSIAQLYARQYEQVVKRGGDTLNKIPFNKGNYDVMENLFKVGFKLGQVSPVPFDLIGFMGKGVIGYWIGGEMRTFPTPTIPAPGSTGNLVVLENRVLNPGTWPKLPTFPLAPSPEPFVNQFIAASKIHLNSVSGLMVTISTYPPAFGPGIIQWTGYQII